jgi:hypothetical protein
MPAGETAAEPLMPIPTLVGRTFSAAALVVLLAPVLPAAQTAPAVQPISTAVDFAPAAAANMQRYGAAERATLQSAIVAAVSRESSCGIVAAGLVLTVTVDNVAPTHPTAKQLSDDPSLDVVRTRYLGGAELSGELRDASRRVVAAVTYRYYPQTLALGSVSHDPWADARLAIEGFAARLATACRDLGRHGGSSSLDSSPG